MSKNIGLFVFAGNMPSDAAKKRAAKKKETAKARQQGKKPTAANTNGTTENGEDGQNGLTNGASGKNHVIALCTEQYYLPFFNDVYT